MKQLFKSNALFFGIISGATISVILTLCMTLWAWIENPSGIFHNQDGTNWVFVRDTALSWLIPTFAYGTFAASLAHLLSTRIRRARRRYLQGDQHKPSV